MREGKHNLWRRVNFNCVWQQTLHGRPAPGVAFYLQLTFWMDCCCVGTDVRVLAEMQDGVKLLLFGLKSHLNASQFDQTKKTVGEKRNSKWCSIYYQSWYQRWQGSAFSSQEHVHNGLIAHDVRLRDSCCVFCSNFPDYKFILCSSRSDVPIFGEMSRENVNYIKTFIKRMRSWRNLIMKLMPNLKIEGVSLASWLDYPEKRKLNSLILIVTVCSRLWMFPTVV